MKLVIDIPDGYAEKALSGKYDLASFCDLAIRKALINGTPLPKGHGDLKDADKLKNAFIKWSRAVQGSFTDSDIASIVYNSPTIIEADKEINE